MGVWAQVECACEKERIAGTRRFVGCGHPGGRVIDDFYVDAIHRFGALLASGLWRKKQSLMDLPELSEILREVHSREVVRLDAENLPVFFKIGGAVDAWVDEKLIITPLEAASWLHETQELGLSVEHLEETWWPPERPEGRELVEAALARLKETLAAATRVANASIATAKPILFWH